MNNKVNTFFEWKRDKKSSVEKKYREDTTVKTWQRIDVLYSFIGIYQIGIYVIYPESCRRTNYNIYPKFGGKYYDFAYLTEKISGTPRYMKYAELNKIIEDSGLIEVIDSIGNVIPIWPGGNIDKGARNYCFDIPDIYFGYLYPEWFDVLCQMYPNAFLNSICMEKYSVDTKSFLDGMTKNNYIEFLNHAVKVITGRSNLLKK